MTAEVAAKRRSELETILVRKFEDRWVEITDPGIHTKRVTLYDGIIRTIGVEWLGNDEFEVIINLDGRRITMPYEDFIINTIGV